MLYPYARTYYKMLKKSAVMLFGAGGYPDETKIKERHLGSNRSISV
jgi:hypothetical protein